MIPFLFLILSISYLALFGGRENSPISSISSKVIGMKKGSVSYVFQVSKINYVTALPDVLIYNSM